MLKWLQLQDGTNLYLMYFWMRILHFVSHFLRSSSWSFSVVDDNEQLMPNSVLFVQQVPAGCLWQVPVQPEVAGHALCLVPVSSFHCSCSTADSLTPYSNVTSTVSAERNISLCHNMPYYLQWHNSVTLPQDLHAMFCKNTCDSRAEVEPPIASPPSCSHNIFSWLKYFWFIVSPVVITISLLSSVWVGFSF